MFKRSMLSVVLVTAVVFQSVQAADDVVSSVSYMGSAKQSIQANWASIANSVSTHASALKGFTCEVFSPSNHKLAFAAINEARENHGFKAACGEFLNNTSTVVATGLAVTAVAAACYAAYNYYFQAKN